MRKLLIEYYYQRESLSEQSFERSSVYAQFKKIESARMRKEGPSSGKGKGKELVGIRSL